MAELGSLKAGEEFRMWNLGPVLHVVENKGDTVVIQRGTLDMTKQELPASQEIVTEQERDTDLAPSSPEAMEQLQDALRKSPVLKDVRVIPPRS